MCAGLGRGKIARISASRVRVHPSRLRNQASRFCEMTCRDGGGTVGRGVTGYHAVRGCGGITSTVCKHRRQFREAAMLMGSKFETFGMCWSLGKNWKLLRLSSYTTNGLPVDAGPQYAKVGQPRKPDSRLTY